MIERGKDNPYISQSNRIHGFQEFPMAVGRLWNSFEQRYTSTPEKAQTWLDTAIAICRENNIFANEEEIKIEKKIGSGFNTSVFLFNAEGQKWVIKVGAKRAPVPGWFNPSAREYAEWYSGNLNIIQDHFRNILPNLIPAPQYVMYGTNALKESTTMVIQPFITDCIMLENASTLPENAKETVLRELQVFYEEFEELYKKHNFIPDFGSKDNLGIKLINGEYHIVLIDDGMIDFKAISPVLNAYSHIRYHLRLRKSIYRLRKLLNK